MKTHLRLFAALLTIVISFNANAQLKKFKVEIPQQPKIKISDSIQSLTLLNRSLSPEFQNYVKDSLQNSFYKQNFTCNRVILDSIASDTTIQALSELLFESGRFDVVIPVERNIYRLLPFSKTPEPLNWSYVESVCETYNTDALIVLENIAMHTVTSYQTQKELVDYSFERSYSASIDFYSRAHWRIYDPKSKTIIVDYKANEDTLSWDSFEYSLVPMFNKLPTIKEAGIETGIEAAINFSELIAPKWNEETRYYYTLNDSTIDKSITFASDGDWNAALQNWLNFVDSGNKAKKAKIMLNCALASEMTGDLDQAIEWAKKSQSTYYYEISNFYLKQLILRKNGATKK